MRHTYLRLCTRGTKIICGVSGQRTCDQNRLTTGTRIPQPTREMDRQSCRSVTPPIRRRPSIAGRLVPVRNDSTAQSDRSCGDQSSDHRSTAIPCGRRNLHGDNRKDHSKGRRSDGARGQPPEAAIRPQRQTPAQLPRQPRPQQLLTLSVSTSTVSSVARPARQQHVKRQS
jgi:hypothetical protein